MSWKLLGQILNGGQSPAPMWRERPLKSDYEVVIVGGGVHGLACAHYLARDHGLTDVAVIERKYIGYGGSGRNTAIVRSNYLTPEGVRFYDESVKLYQQMAEELDFNIMFAQRGHMTLAHSDGALRTLRRRAEVNQIEGIDSRVIEPDEIARLVPWLDVSRQARHPIEGALYHPPGGIVRHDAVVWAYAHHAFEQGVDIHQNTEVTDIEVKDGKVEAVMTDRGRIKTAKVLNATAGWCSTVASLAGVKLPITTRPLQALVTEPVKPFLNTVVVSGSLHTYVSQTGRGELVMGAAVDPFSSYSQRGSLAFAEGMASHLLELMPALSQLKVLRQWAGLCDMSPDYSPVMGLTPVEGFYLDVGWGTYGFKAAPVSGKRMAELLATDEVPELIRPFRLARFHENRLVGEKGAASVGY